MRYLIVGYSIAGVSASRAIRQIQPDAEIVAVTDEKKAPYYRPLIPLLIEDREIDITFPDDPASEFRVEVIHARAEGLDPDKKELILSNGQSITYDRLLISTGGTPILPSIEGINSEGVFTLRTYADAVNIKGYATGRKKAVVIGGGLVGIKGALALRGIGLKVTIVEMLEHILKGRLDSAGADTIRQAVEREGVSVYTSETVEEIVSEEGSVKAVKLSSGKVLDADLVLIAIGVKPSVDFLKDSGIEIKRGIVVNETLQCSIPDIYAAGDVVEYVDIVTGSQAVSGLWSNAEEMGRIAGSNMAGQKLRYSGFLSVMNATEILGIPFISVGVIESDVCETHVSTLPNGYRRLLFSDDKLVGAVFMGEVEKAGLYASLIKNKITLGNLKDKAIAGTLSYVDIMSPMLD
jgi:NAD(P)H-nitrite reductase large subunit